MAVKNYLLGGRLGDFIHCLVIPYYNYITHGVKANIFITNERDPFMKGIDFTFQELQPILEEQEYIESFQKHNPSAVSIDCDLRTFRDSRYMFARSWNEILFNSFIEKPHTIPIDMKWLTSKNYQPKEVVLINRSLRHISGHTIGKYTEQIDQYRNSGEGVYFICCDKVQFQSFPLNYAIEPIICHSLKEMFERINDCSLFIGNQSAPLAIATALNKPRLAELRHGPDAVHYKSNTHHSKTLNWFEGD